MEHVDNQVGRIKGMGVVLGLLRAAGESEAKAHFCEKCAGLGKITWLEDGGNRFCSADCPDCKADEPEVIDIDELAAARAAYLKALEDCENASEVNAAARLQALRWARERLDKATGRR
jgi:hypothetical protein